DRLLLCKLNLAIRQTTQLAHAHATFEQQQQDGTVAGALLVEAITARQQQCVDRRHVTGRPDLLVDAWTRNPIATKVAGLIGQQQAFISEESPERAEHTVAALDRARRQADPICSRAVCVRLVWHTLVSEIREKRA